MNSSWNGPAQEVVVHDDKMATKFPSHDTAQLKVKMLYIIDKLQFLPR
jgi:hypothetical protein